MLVVKSDDVVVWHGTAVAVIRVLVPEIVVGMTMVVMAVEDVSLEVLTTSLVVLFSINGVDDADGVVVEVVEESVDVMIVVEHIVTRLPEEAETVQAAEFELVVVVWVETMVAVMT